jgi:hypothetical protein
MILCGQYKFPIGLLQIIDRIILIADFSTIVPLTSCVFFPVQNAALTTKGLQGKKQPLSGTTVEK